MSDHAHERRPAQAERPLSPQAAEAFRREMAERGMSGSGNWLFFAWDGPGRQRRGKTERHRAAAIARMRERTRKADSKPDA
ncbi:MAG TPA: hypothetical protein DCS97_07155 [Planctomycetes bacterium]|nr:hypothetical protein [Planctomycetota bacterium]